MWSSLTWSGILTLLQHVQSWLFSYNDKCFSSYNHKQFSKNSLKKTYPTFCLFVDMFSLQYDQKTSLFLLSLTLQHLFPHQSLFFFSLTKLIRVKELVLLLRNRKSSLSWRLSPCWKTLRDHFRSDSHTLETLNSYKHFLTLYIFKDAASLCISCFSIKTIL